MARLVGEGGGGEVGGMKEPVWVLLVTQLHTQTRKGTRYSRLTTSELCFHHLLPFCSVQCPFNALFESIQWPFRWYFDIFICFFFYCSAFTVVILTNVMFTMLLNSAHSNYYCFPDQHSFIGTVVWDFFFGQRFHKLTPPMYKWAHRNVIFFYSNSLR